MPTHFAKRTLTHCFNSVFFNFQRHANELSTFPVYVNEEIFVKSQFHKCVNAQMRKFTCNVQIKMTKFTNVIEFFKRVRRLFI